MATLEVRHIVKSFGQAPVLRGISLDIASGQFVGLLGPSGCGKTTLLRIIAGLESVQSGAVLIDGRDVTAVAPEERDIAMMFQSYALLPHLSVRENVRFPLRMRRRGSRAAQLARATAALDTVKLAHLAERMPAQLSGGQQQRVALARAIVSDPKLLLLDEPLSNLDARLREEMQVELIDLHRRLGLTTVFVTHDQEEALSLSDRVVLINAGRIEQTGTPHEIYSDPKTPFASDFIGSANLVAVDIERVPGGSVARLCAAAVLPVGETAPSGTATLVLRQEDLVLARAQSAPPPPGTLRAVVETRIYLGARVRYVLRVGEIRLKALAAPNELFEVGDALDVTVAPGRSRLIEA